MNKKIELLIKNLATKKSLRQDDITGGFHQAFK
jgi:hypothetical protein